jgi:hypothetical protein
MSNARAYMMVYLLSVVSVFRFVLVVGCLRRGASLEPNVVTGCHSGEADVSRRACEANTWDKEASDVILALVIVTSRDREIGNLWMVSSII